MNKKKQNNNISDICVCVYRAQIVRKRDRGRFNKISKIVGDFSLSFVFPII